MYDIRMHSWLSELVPLQHHYDQSGEVSMMGPQHQIQHYNHHTT